jgi:hypothetical protein
MDREREREIHSKREGGRGREGEKEREIVYDVLETDRPPTLNQILR